MTQLDVNPTDIKGHLTQFDYNPTHIDGYPTQIDENLNPLAIALASTFAIYPELAYSPIAKELAAPSLFCLSGNMVS